MKNNLNGYIEGMYVIIKKNEKKEVMRCLKKWKESIEVKDMEIIENGMEIIKKSDLNEIRIEGEKKKNIVIMVRKIG